MAPRTKATVTQPSNTERWNDVSSFQGFPNYLQVKADGISGVITRVNEGNYEDGSLGWNWPRIVQAGLKRGGYDFAWTANTPQYEANEFLTYLKSVGGWLPNDILVLDAEQNSGNLTPSEYSQWCLSWLSIVMNATGIRPWLYSYENWIATYLQNTSLNVYPLWLALPSATVWPSAPAPWTKLAAWQYGDGTEPGISGAVDLDFVSDPPVPCTLIDMSNGYSVSGFWVQSEEQFTVVCTPSGNLVYRQFPGKWGDITLPTPSVPVVPGTLDAFYDSGGALHILALGTNGTQLHWWATPVAAGSGTAPSFDFQTLGSAAAAIPSTSAALTPSEASQLSDADAKASDADARITKIENALGTA